MNWLVIDEKYLDFLREREPRIPRSNYGANKYKPFFGVLFETSEFYYVTQISHAQRRHENMKSNIDFKKVYDPKTGRLLAVINLNYMFPILKWQLLPLEYKNIGLYRNFVSEEEKSKYIDLLKTEMQIISTMNLERSAKVVYENKYTLKNRTLANRCIDFEAMEKLSKEYSFFTER